jgi:glycosyltransferase involved in cell wall biosynthesis
VTRAAPLVSVVVPTYNCAQYLPEAVDSVLGQSYERRELIVVDDGSIDDTRVVLGRYGDRLRYLFQKNRGIGGARARGLEEARGELVAFLDADDVWMPHKLEHQVEALTRHPECAFVFADAVDFGDMDGGVGTRFAGRRSLAEWCDRHRGDGGVAVGWAYEELLLEDWPIYPSSVLMRRACLDAVGGYALACGLGWSEADYAVWLALGRRWAVGVMGETLFRYRRRADSDSEQIRRAGASARKRAAVLAAHLETDGGALALSGEAKRALAGYHLRQGWRSARAGRHREGRAAVRVALRYGRRAQAVRLLIGSYLREAIAHLRDGGTRPGAGAPSAPPADHGAR